MKIFEAAYDYFVNVMIDSKLFSSALEKLIKSWEEVLDITELEKLLFDSKIILKKLNVIFIDSLHVESMVFLNNSVCINITVKSLIIPSL